MRIDDQTWDDLLLEQYCERVGGSASLFGRDSLRDRLRHGAGPAPSTASAGAVAATRERVAALLADSALDAAVSTACRPLTGAESAVTGILSAPISTPPRWASYLWLPPLAFLASSLLALVWWPLWLVAIALWLALMGLQMTYHTRMQLWQVATRSLQLQLGAHVALSASTSGYLSEFRPDAQQADKLRRLLSRSVISRTPGASEYGDWIMLDNLKHYFATHRLVIAHAQMLRDSYASVSAIDADLALARHLRTVPAFCWAAQDSAIQLQGVVHPLLEHPQPLDIDVQRGAFISGQNGVGKSTLLRTVGINVLTARAFGFCYARQASVPMLAVCASMKSTDAMEQGESLYIAELRRAKEMLALAKGSQRTVFLIDEVFRGTNHLESVSAGAAVLQVLAERDCLLVSSHNVVLGTLLENSLTPLFVTQEEGRLTLKPGLLRHTNGIELLRRSGFDPAIEARALEVHGWLSSQLEAGAAPTRPVLVRLA